jgi:hypothetical protein
VFPPCRHCAGTRLKLSRTGTTSILPELKLVIYCAATREIPRDRSGRAGRIYLRWKQGHHLITVARLPVSLITIQLGNLQEPSIRSRSWYIFFPLIHEPKGWLLESAHLQAPCYVQHALESDRADLQTPPDYAKTKRNIRPSYSNGKLNTDL